jgi:hypothetical protein
LPAFAWVEFERQVERGVLALADKRGSGDLLILGDGVGSSNLSCGTN